ncbi:MAG: hypothetical protein BWY55_00619 [archaeon ADurb.Bin336]|nr:MAG: hypothetical protein BWY55_00619 [archaeon ADurb.Bin336]
MKKEDLINQMIDEIKSLEDETEGYCFEIQPPKLEDYGKTDDEKFKTFVMKENYRREQIQNVVLELANKFDLDNPKTYLQIKEIAIIKLFQNELHKQAVAELTIEKNTKSKKNSKDLFAEYRKNVELISKLLGKVYIAPTIKEEKIPSRQEIYGTNKYIIID